MYHFLVHFGPTWKICCVNKARVVFLDMLEYLEGGHQVTHILMIKCNVRQEQFITQWLDQKPITHVIGGMEVTLIWERLCTKTRLRFVTDCAYNFAWVNQHVQMTFGSNVAMKKWFLLYKNPPIKINYKEEF